MTRGATIGVDCGGTQCRIAWADGSRRVDFLGRGANFTTDPAGCARAITVAARALADKAQISMTELCAARAYVGVAGVMSSDQGDALAKALPFSDAQVEDDRRALVYGALAHRNGFVASIGTGSFVASKTFDTVRSVGGWGLMLGDEASGAWLGRGLLRMCLQAHDGMVPRTALTEAVLDEFGGPEAIVDFSRDAIPADYARLAPGLAGAAEAGDPQGRILMKTGADWIARALEALGWEPRERLVLPGPLGKSYVPFLPKVMAAAVTEPLGTSLDGALALAGQTGIEGAA